MLHLNDIGNSLLILSLSKSYFLCLKKANSRSRDKHLGIGAAGSPSGAQFGQPCKLGPKDPEGLSKSADLFHRLDRFRILY